MRRLLFLLIFCTTIYRGQIVAQSLKQWTVTGPGEPAFKKLDDFMNVYMQQYEIKAGALAIAKDGKIVYARGYTLADKSYPITLPTSLFRIASLSKPVTSLEIHRLIAVDSLELETLVQDKLKIRLPPQDPKPKVLKTFGNYFDKITIQHLLGHRGGWDRDSNGTYDPTYLHDQEIANSANNGKLPVSKSQLMTWGAAQNQQMFPGTEYHYSNFGYHLLGMVIEKINGRSYTSSVKRNLLSPLGIERPQQARSTLADRRKGEVRYHVIPQTQLPCAISSGTCAVQYGGENIENFDSFGGWLFSPVDYVKLFASFRKKAGPVPQVPIGNLITLRSNPGIAAKTTVFDHGGLLPGTWAYMCYRTDGIDFMVVWNTTNDKASFTYNKTTYQTGNHVNIWHQLLDSITSWPNYDLSPAYFGNTVSNTLTESALYDGIWNYAPQPRIVERGRRQEVILERGKTPGEFQALYTKYYNLNYRLSSQQSYLVNGVLLRDGIWLPSQAGQFVTWDKPLDEFAKLYSEWSNKNYRLVSLQPYVRSGKIYYTGIWNPGTTQQFVTWEKSLPEFTALNSEWVKKGFRLVSLHSVQVNGKKLYSGIWDRGNQVHLITHEKKREEIAALYDQYFKKNFRLIHLQGYYQDNQLLYDAIWAPGEYGQYVSWGKNNEWIDAENIIQNAHSFRPYLLTAY